MALVGRLSYPFCQFWKIEFAFSELIKRSLLSDNAPDELSVIRFSVTALSLASTRPPRGAHSLTDMQRVLIAVVDDDESIRESLPELLKTLGFAARPFASAAAFLSSDTALGARCLILDVSMPEMTGPQLQIELNRRGMCIPIIFITGQCDGELRATLLARGAVECLSKPFTERALRSALDAALGAG